MSSKSKKPQKKLNIFINISENSGVGLYRQFLPALALRERGLANVLINDFTYGESRIFCKLNGFPECDFTVQGYNPPQMADEYVEHLKIKHNVIANAEEKNKYEQSVVSMVEPTVETLGKIGHWANIIIFGRRDTPDYLSTFGGIREFFNIPIVMDTDDNVHATRPFNPGYRGYYPGSEALIWNKKTAAEVDALTTSTENLRSVHLKDNRNIYVLPNCVDFARWKKAPRPAKDGIIRIGLLVSASHHEDCSLLKNVILKIVKKYKNVHFYYTNMFHYIFGESEQIHPVPWIALKNWPEGVVSLNLDIGLAPLVDNFFNRAKSNLRYLEYSAAGIPTIASPTEPYKCIKDGVTGLFASSEAEWTEKIELLVENEQERLKIARNANKYVELNFDVYKQAKIWLDTYKKIIRDFEKRRGQRKFPLQESFALPKEIKTKNPLQTSAI